MVRSYCLKIMGFALAIALFIAGADQALATVTTLTLTNHSFQEPVVTPNANPNNESPFDTDPGSPVGWTYAYIAGAPATESYGVAIPAVAHYGANNPAPAPFDGNQYGFMNLNNDPTSAGGATVGTITSDFVGGGTPAVLQANSTYTAFVSVGARATNSWRDIEYGLSILDADNNTLSTSATLIMDPQTAIPANIQVLRLDVSTALPANQPSVGKNFRVRIHVRNTGNNGTGTFTQANFDNVKIVHDDGLLPPNRANNWTLY